MKRNGKIAVSAASLLAVIGAGSALVVKCFKKKKAIELKEEEIKSNYNDLVTVAYSINSLLREDSDIVVRVRSLQEASELEQVEAPENVSGMVESINETIRTGSTKDLGDYRLVVEYK